MMKLQPLNILHKCLRHCFNHMIIYINKQQIWLFYILSNTYYFIIVLQEIEPSGMSQFYGGIINYHSYLSMQYLILIIKSNNCLKVFKPFYIKPLFAIEAVVSHRRHGLVSNTKLLFQKAVDRLKQLIRKSFHFWTTILIRIENIQSMCPSIFVILGKVDIGDLETFSDNGIDNHSLLASNLGDTDRHFIHISIEILLFLGLLLILFVLFLVELGG